MKSIHSLALCAILAAALTIGTGSAIAQEPRTTPEREQTQRQNPDDQYSRDTVRATQADRVSPDRMQSPTAAGHRMGQGTFLSNKPVRGFHADKLIGSDVKGHGDDNVGKINDLILDENGQVVAVIVGVGGFLGLGEKDVAIGWDALQRTAKGDDDYEYRVNATKDSLTNAPEYKRK